MVAALALTLSAAMPAGATTICRWVDEKGGTQFSDVVPEQFRKSAVCSDSSQHELLPEQQQDARDRAARDKAAATAPKDLPAEEPYVPRAKSVAAGAPTKRPSRGVTNDTDCDTWRRLYAESVECFAPYRTVRDSTKAEAFDRCTEIPSPEPKCGPQSP